MLIGDFITPSTAKIKVYKTTVANGQWSINYTGFNSILSVVPVAIMDTANTYNRVWATLKSYPSNGLIEGYALRGANLSLLGATVRDAPDGTEVTITVIGV